MSKEQYEQELEYSFNAAITGAYFGRALGDAIHEGRIGNFPRQPLKPVHTAWDLGISDSAAIWFFQEV
jgi:phage terminase large subunit